MFISPIFSPYHFKADSPVFEAVFATEGENVALSLPLSKPNDQNCYRVKWTKGASDTRQGEVILARPKTPKFQDAARVRWQANEHGKMFLFLTKLQKSDEGLYSCEVCTGWDCEFLRNVSLKVKGKVLYFIFSIPLL